MRQLNSENPSEVFYLRGHIPGFHFLQQIDNQGIPGGSWIRTGRILNFFHPF